MIGVYEIKNKINDSRYIGSTTNYELRKKQHVRQLCSSKHYNQHLQNAWNKYGESAFVIRLIHKTETEQESRGIEQGYLDSEEKLYNIADLASGGSGLKGENHPSAVFTNTQVESIRADFRNGIALSSLNAKYGHDVGDVVYGKSWSHLGGAAQRRGKSSWRLKEGGGIEKRVVLNNLPTEFESDQAVITEMINQHEGYPLLTGKKI